MTNIREFSLENNAQNDAFGRLRISNPVTIFDSKQTLNDQSLFWDEELGGSASSAHSTTDARTRISVTASASDYGIRQTFMRFNYQPGKSQQIFMTGLFTTETGITKRVGYMDLDYAGATMDILNGIYFQNDAGALSVNITKNGTNTSISQTNWNLDKLDGTGSSGITLDMADVQILVIDFEWLGVGRVRIGFNIDGITYYVHQFLHANNGLQSVYTSNPNLSLRYDIESDGTGSGSIDHICASVISEGGLEGNGIDRAADRGTTGFSAAGNTTIQPVISIRCKAGSESITSKLNQISIIVTTSTDFRWALYLNPTIAGTDNASWTSTGTQSATEYDISRTSANTLSAGELIKSGYVETGGQDQIDIEISSPLHLGRAIDGTLDEFVLGIQDLSGTAETYYASINWKELL